MYVEHLVPEERNDPVAIEGQGPKLGGLGNLRVMPERTLIEIRNELVKK